MVTPTPELMNWLQRKCGFMAPVVQPMRIDAGWRRYFRVSEAGRSVVAMDASAERESCAPFVAIAETLRTAGLRAPEILARDMQRGYLLVTDFGDTLLLERVTPETADGLYGEALSSLMRLQNCEPRHAPAFSAEVMLNELEFFITWYLQRHQSMDLSPAALKMLRRCFLTLVDSATAQPQVFMHRDYHSANLMVLPCDGIGILDFQDACIGPVTYDLVSLLRDCYIRWPEQKVRQWVAGWHADSFLKQSVSKDQFMVWFDLMGVQRHLKAAMIFARKWCRDQDDRYLQHIPRTLNYVFSVLPSYSIFSGLNDFLLSAVGETCVE